MNAGSSEGGLVKYQSWTEEEKAEIRADVGLYHLAIHPRYTHVEFQQKYLAPALHLVAEHQIWSLMILMPPRHAKTDLATKSFIAWLFGRWPHLKNMLLSYSDDFAQVFGKDIVKNIKSEQHQILFPESRISRTADSGHYFKTTAGGEFSSAGFGGKITGLGVDGVLVIDDPVKNEAEASSPAIMRERFADYEKTADTRVECGSKLICTTRWGAGDFVERVMDAEGEISEGGEWTILKIPAEAGEGDPLGREPGSFLWPEHFRPGHYERLKRKPHVWFPMYQQDPHGAYVTVFKLEWLCFYPKKPKPGKFPTYMLTDRGGYKSTSDPTFIAVFCTTPEKRILLVDGSLGRFNPDEVAAEHIRLIRKWKPRRWIYEEVGLQNDTWYLKQAAKKEGVAVNPIAVGRKGPRHMITKDKRIRELTSDFSLGRIWLPDIYGDEKESRPAVPFPSWKWDGEEEINIIQYFIEHEYLLYAGEGSIQNDEILDVMSRLHEPELGLVFPASGQDITAQFVRGHRRLRRRGGWEAVL